ITNREDVGAFGRREIALISSSIPSMVRLMVKSSDQKGNHREALYPILFGGERVIEENPIPAPDGHDTTGPRIVVSVPTRESQGVALGQPIVLKFDEPIDRSVLREAPVIFAMMPGNLRPTLELSPDQYELSLFFHDLLPDATYT